MRTARETMGPHIMLRGCSRGLAGTERRVTELKMKRNEMRWLICISVPSRD